MASDRTPPFWRFLEAEALDGLQLPEGRVAQAVVIVEVYDPAAEGTRTVRISRHESGRRLRPNEEAGMLVRALSRALDE